MIRTLLATAVAAGAWRLYKSGKLDEPVRKLTERISALLPASSRAPALAEAYSGANASRPAPAHPWPVDPLSLGKSAPTPDAA